MDSEADVNPFCEIFIFFKDTLTLKKHWISAFSNAFGKFTFLV
ncbi:hypothetical protein HOLDEFILI_02508 [Holdemania filiformis DSM 12042]|uniref:Uncharacterized protein n=1 Tax=Holdemania filiformis DSM 12042 TaxID=545696 RepID=B9Y9K2_9FIRM|nr:hypothetical protein HOLDEFILI_02508 [Holdemania filiformis DSM 12042]